MAIFISLLERVNTDKESGDELYEATHDKKAGLVVPASSTDVSFTPIIRPEGAPIGATVTVQIPSPASKVAPHNSSPQETPQKIIASCEDDSNEFVTPLSSPQPEMEPHSPDEQVKTDSGGNSKQSGLNKLLSAAIGCFTKNRARDELTDSVSANTPGATSQAANDGEYEADSEEGANAELNKPQLKKKPLKRKKRTRPPNKNDTDDEDQASSSKPTPETVECVPDMTFEFVPNRATRSKEKKAPKFDVNMYIKTFIDNNPGIGTRSKRNLVTAATEQRRLDTQCVASLTGDDVVRASDEDEVAEAGSSKDIPTEQYQVSKVTNCETRKLSITLKKIEPDNGDFTASEVESDVNEPTSFKKTLPSILRPKMSVIEKPAKPAEEPTSDPSTSKITPKKPRKEKLVVMDSGAIIINGQKMTLSLASPKSKSQVLVASPAKDGSLKMKIRSPNKPSFKIDNEAIKSSEKKPKGQSPTKLKKPVEVDSMPAEKKTPQKKKGRPRKSEVETPKKIGLSSASDGEQGTPKQIKSRPVKLGDAAILSILSDEEAPKNKRGRPSKSAVDDEEKKSNVLGTPERKRGRPPKSADQKIQSKKLGRLPKVVAEDDDSMSDNQETPKKGRGRPPKSAAEEDDEPATPRGRRGRPPKSSERKIPVKKRASKLAAEDDKSLSDEREAPKKSRGRPPKLAAKNDESTSSELDTPKKRRGRPPKSAERKTPAKKLGRPPKLTTDDESLSDELETPKKKRGRPPKSATKSPHMTPNKKTPGKRRLSLQPITPIKSPASRRLSMAPRMEAVQEETPSKRRRLLSQGNFQCRVFLSHLYNFLGI